MIGLYIYGMKDVTKLIGYGSVAAVGIYSAIMTAMSRQQEINSNKEIELKKLEYQKEMDLQKLEFQKEMEFQRLNIEKEKFEFEKIKFEYSKNMFNNNSNIDNNPSIKTVSDYNDQFKITFDQAKISDVNNNPVNNNVDLNSSLDNSNLLVENMSLTFICFTSVTILLTISLTFNYLVNMYGEKLLEKLPKMFHPLFRFYQKYLLIPILFDFSLILLCQTVGLILSLFIYLT